MKFSYFSNAYNTYNNNTRNTNVLILEIVDQAIFAEKIGMHSVWVGEHHFNEFGIRNDFTGTRIVPPGAR